MTDQRQHILIIKLGALGDFVMQMDHVQAIHAAWPDAHITFMTSKAFVPFVKCLDWVDEIIVDTHPRLNLKQWYVICKRCIADKKWDFIFDLQNSRRTRERYFSLVRFFTPFSFKWCSYNKNKPLRVRSVEKHQRFSLGKMTTSEMPLDLKPVDLSFCKGKQENFHLLPKEKFVLFIPGCSAKHPYKKWPVQSYVALAKMLEEKNIPVVVLGTSMEAMEIDSICAQTHALSFKDKASLLDIPALADKTLCVIGNDTGPVHMACLCHTHGIVLFGGQTAKSAQKLPNVVNIIRDNIADITPEEVYEVFNKMDKG